MSLVTMCFKDILQTLNYAADDNCYYNAVWTLWGLWNACVCLRLKRCGLYYAAKASLRESPKHLATICARCLQKRK